MFKTYLLNKGRDVNLEITPRQLEQFDTYYKLLVAWNHNINLTALTSLEDVAIKHMLDSLSGYDAEFFSEGCALIDVGTGAGFPGLPLKIMYPDIKLTLVDSLNKRVGFLREVIEQLGLTDVQVYHSRAEDFAHDKSYREQYDVAVSRAVARLNILCELCIPFVKISGHFLAFKGAKFEEELLEAQPAIKVLGAAVSKVKPVKLPTINDTRAILYIVKQRPSPNQYPRKPGILEKKPL